MRRIPVLFLLALVAIVAFAAPAAAHTELVTTSPAAGARAKDAVRAVTISFTQPVDARLATVTVQRADGPSVSTGTPRAAGADLVQPLTELESGRYDVAWRAAAADGHILTGDFSFRVGASATPKAEADRPTADELLLNHDKAGYGHDKKPAYAISAADRRSASDGRSKTAAAAAPADAVPVPAPAPDNSGTMIVALLGAAVFVTTATAVWESVRAHRV